jgi:hypothetical protein
MRIICTPEDHKFAVPADGDLNVMLYGHVRGPNTGAVGATVRRVIQHRKLEPAARAWDLLSIALSVVVADTAARRDESPDGWTRQLDLHVAVGDPVFWTAQRDLLTRQLGFLTGDIWNITWLDGGVQRVPPKTPARPEQDCIVLLSGGLDSLIGAIDLVKAQGKNPYAVSQVSSARSIGFLAYGVLAATALKRYHDGGHVTLYVCENGFISINPPLTGTRLGSLSTRTTHPFYIRLFQELLDAAGLRVTFANPTSSRPRARCWAPAPIRPSLRNTPIPARAAGATRATVTCIAAVVFRALSAGPLSKRGA